MGSQILLTYLPSPTCEPTPSPGYDVKGHRGVRVGQKPLPGNASEDLLVWVNRMIPEHKTTNFTSDWRDG